MVRGEKSDQAVLCTKDQTYDIRVAETSNTLLMMPEFDFLSELESHPEPVILHRAVKCLPHQIINYYCGQVYHYSHIFSRPGSILQQAAVFKSKGKFLYSAVSNSQDRSKHFTSYFPDIPVHSDTISVSLGSIQPYATINARRLLIHISTIVYSQVLIYTTEWTGAM